MCTFLSISYKYVFIRVILFTYSHCIFVYVVMYSTMAHSNRYIHILLYSVLIYYTVHVSGVK